MAGKSIKKEAAIFLVAASFFYLRDVFSIPISCIN